MWGNASRCVRLAARGATGLINTLEPYANINTCIKVYTSGLVVHISKPLLVGDYLVHSFHIAMVFFDEIL